MSRGRGSGLRLGIFNYNDNRLQKLGNELKEREDIKDIVNIAYIKSMKGSSKVSFSQGVDYTYIGYEKKIKLFNQVQLFLVNLKSREN